jgi:two-component system cell cycle response regulator
VPASVASAAAPEKAAPTRRTLHDRISAVLDTALFESVIAGEVRALASAGEIVRLFEGLAGLLCDVLSYRWMALLPARTDAPLLLHGHASEGAALEATVRAALSVGAERTVATTLDDRAIPTGTAAVEIWPVLFAGTPVAKLALAPTARGLARDERRLVQLVAAELGGPLQMSALYEDAQRMATTDALTGLLNRRAFLESVERERARSDRHVLPFSLLLLDIDHFKRVNDTRGHAAGDAVLKGVAQVLTKVARRSDVVARWGGEEFVIALAQTGEAGARVAAERVRRAIAASSHPAPEGEPLVVTASIGVASAESPWLADELISAADAAMYAAKGRGRNRVEIHSTAEAPTAARPRPILETR